MFVIKTTNSEKIASSLVEILINRVKFIYSEKATKFCEIFPLLLTMGPFKYYVIKVGGWGQNMAIFDNLQYCKSSKRWVGGWV